MTLLRPSKDSLARHAEINIDLDATRMYNTGRIKKNTHETERRKWLLLS